MIALDKNDFTVGQTPWVLVTMNNRTDHSLPFHFDTIWLHIEGENGEPPTKLSQRMATGKLLPGETSLSEDGNE
jgi:FtsP/CotA-like multicopper oxidase with cupredoxin domain